MSFSYRKISLLLCFLAAVFLSACSPPVDPEALLERAQGAYSEGELGSAEVDLKTVLSEQPENSTARALYGRIYFEQLNHVAAIGEFERSLAVRENSEIRLELAKALVYAGNSAELLSDWELGVYAAIEASDEFQAALSRAYLDQADPDNARQAFDDAGLSLDSATTYVLITAALVDAQARQDLESAETKLQAVVENDPSSAEAWSMLGALALARRDLEAAESNFANAVQASPYRITDRVQLAEIRIRLGKNDAADNDVAQMEAIAPQYPPINMLRAQLSFDSGQYQDALDSLAKVKLANPNHLGALVLAANANIRLNQLATAQRDLEQAVAIVPSNAQVLLQLANVYLLSGSFEQAEQAARGVLQADENSQVALEILAGSLSRQGFHGESAQVYSRLAALRPDSVELMVALGSEQVVAGDFESGFQQLESAVSLAPESEIAQSRLVQAKLAAGDLVDAETAARAFVAEAPESADAVALLARVRMQQGQVDDASVLFNESLELEPGNLLASAGVATLAMVDGNLDRAASALRTAFELHPSHLPTSLALAMVLEQAGDSEGLHQVLRDAVAANPDALEPRLALARSFLIAKDYERAAAELVPVEKVYADDPRVHRVLAGAYLASAQLDAARTSARKLLALDPEQPLALKLSARVDIASGNADDASSKLQRALAADAEDLEARGLYIDTLVLQQKWDEALVQFDKLPLEVRENPKALSTEGRLAMARGDSERAIGSFERLHELQPSSASVALLAGANWNSDQQGIAMELLTSWLEESPDDMNVRGLLASWQLGLSDETAAIEQYAVIVEEQPDNTVALNNLAWMLKESDTEQALSYIERAMELSPSNPDVMDTYAMVLLEAGDADKALEQNRKALTLSDRDHFIELNRAQILVELDRKADAKNLLSRLVNSEDSDLAAQAQTMLAELD